MGQMGHCDLFKQFELNKHAKQLQKHAIAVQQTQPGGDNDNDEQSLRVEERDVISGAEAKKSTGYVESIGYSLKRLVWS